MGAGARGEGGGASRRLSRSARMQAEVRAVVEKGNDFGFWKNRKFSISSSPRRSDWGKGKKADDGGLSPPWGRRRGASAQGGGEETEVAGLNRANVGAGDGKSPGRRVGPRATWGAITGNLGV